MKKRRGRKCSPRRSWKRRWRRMRWLCGSSFCWATATGSCVSSGQEVFFFLVGLLRTFHTTCCLPPPPPLTYPPHFISYCTSSSCCCSPCGSPSCTSFPFSCSVILNDDVTTMMSHDDVTQIMSAMISVVRCPTVSQSVADDQLMDPGAVKGPRSGSRSGSEPVVKC